MRKRSEAEPGRQATPVPPVAGSNGPARPCCFNAVWNGNRVALLTREDDGRVTKRDVPAEYSCFIPAVQFLPVESKLRGSPRVRGYRQEGDWFRVRFASWQDRKDCCAPARGGAQSPFKLLGLDCYEADLNPVKRWLADNDVDIQRPRRAYLDIETDSRVPFSEKSRMRILCWSIVNEAGEKTLGMLEHDTDEAERALLEDLWFELQDYEQVAAWYGGDFKEDGYGFDFPLICSRTNRYHLAVDPRRWLWVDQLEAFKKFNSSSGDSGDEKQSFALDNVAKEVLKTEHGKLDGVDGSMAWQLWSAGGESRRLLGRYCVQDTDLLRRIEEKTQFLSLLDAISQSCGTFPDNYGMKGVNFVESYLLRLGRQRGYHFPSNWRDKGSEPFAGAYVMEPTETGILRNVHVCDFAGLYPSVIQTFNMSLETHRPELKRGRVSTTGPSYLPAAAQKDAPLPDGVCVVPLTGEVFAVEPSGILPDALTSVRERRKYFDKLKASFAPGTTEFTNAERGAQGCKIYVNTFYGVAGSPFSRIFSRAVGESTTQASVWLIKNVIRVVSERAMRGVYGDTDSVFVTGTTEQAFRALVAELNDVIFPALLREQGCVRNEIRLEYEKEFAVLILVGKKRYAGRYRQYKGKPALPGAKPEIKGLEYRRGDTAKICRDFQKRVIDTLLGGDERLETYVALVAAERERVLKGNLDRAEFVMSKRLSGSTDSYRTKKKKDGEDTSKPIHVQVAEHMKASGQDVSEGTRISYVVTDASDKLVAVPLGEYVEGSEDRFYLWENLVYPATQRVLEVCFKTHDWRQYEKARPPKPRKGRKVADEQMAFPEFGAGALESK